MKGYAPGKSPMIKGLVPSLPEKGKIKIGKKGEMRTSKNGKEFQLPEKLNHFLVTTLERDKGDNFMLDADVHELLGEKPTRIPVKLLYDDIPLNFQSRYASFNGRTLWCSGDGEFAWRQRNGKVGDKAQMECPCEYADPAYTGEHKCKMTGCLSAIIDDVDIIGGVWKFRTTSYNSIVSIASTLALIKRLTGGKLSGIPLDMVLAPKTTVIPSTDKTQTIYVVSLEYRGSVAQLQDTAYQMTLRDATHKERIQATEDEARRLLSGDIPEEEISDFVDEYNPEQAIKAEEANGENVTVVGGDEGQKPETPALAEPAKKTTKRKSSKKKEPEPEPEPEPEQESEGAEIVGEDGGPIDGQEEDWF